jgi:hypothetical protein
MNRAGQLTTRKGDAAASARWQRNAPGAPAGGGPTRIPPGRTWLWFAIALLLNFVLARYLVPGGEVPLTIPYTLFKEEVSKGNVKAIYSRGETLTGLFAAPVTYPPPEEGAGGAAAANATKPPSVRDRRERRPRSRRHCRRSSAPASNNSSSTTASRSAPSRSRKAAVRCRRCCSDSARRCC